jgi:hypothetical protein
LTKILTLALAALLFVTTEATATRPTKGRPVKTGQTLSYGTGSDGNLQNGLSPMFKDLGNGVIKDQRSGLFWEKKSNDGSIHDKDNTYTWGQGASPFSMNGTMVTTFLATLNTPPCFGGYCDWRIPNRKELETWSDLGTYDPGTFAPFNTDCTAGCTVTTCSCTGSGNYWSSSTSRLLPSDAWFVDFYDGGAYYDSKTDGRYVRAVRGGS